MTYTEWFSLAKDGGAYVCPFLLAAILWLNVDRNRLIKENQLKDNRLVDIAERSIAVSTELKMFLFNERRST